MKVKKRAILLGLVVLLTITILAGCENPPKGTEEQPPPSEKLTAKEALAIIDSAKETLGVDGVLVYIDAWNRHDELAITDGAAPIWIAEFYSESEKTVQGIQYFAYQTSTHKNEPQYWGEAYSNVLLSVHDLADWNIDSPEACDIAAQNGGEGIEWMRLQTADLEPLSTSPIYITPEFIPDRQKFFGSSLMIMEICTISMQIQESISAAKNLDPDTAD